MARIRTIKPELFFDDELAELSHVARLVFIGLFCLADKEGILLDKPKIIKANLLPYENADMDSILNELSRKPFVHRYEVDGEKYLYVKNFKKHQRTHHTEAESTFPLFNGEITVKQPISTREIPEGKEGKGKEGKEAAPSARPFEKLSTGVVDKAKIAQDLGFNVYQQVALFNKGRSNALPESVIHEILDEFHDKRNTIKDIFPYMALVIKEKSRRFWANAQQAEHEAIKKGPSQAGSILRQLQGAGA
jgi:hypothetical protein